MRANKGRANTVLGWAMAVFALAVVLRYLYPDSFFAKLLLTVAEASLAGGVADWFAVTALFCRPLGVPFHTALIPRNRSRIVEALAAAVEEEFLSKQTIKHRLEKAGLLAKIIDRVSDQNVGQAARKIIERGVDEVANSLEPAVVAKYLERMFKLIIKRQTVAPYIVAALEWGMVNGKEQQVYDIIVNECASLVREPKTREAIFVYLEKLKQKTAGKTWLSALVTGFMERTDSLNLADAADALHQELILVVDELRSKEHPVRQWFQDELATVAGRLASAEWEEAIETWKDSLVTRISLAEPLTAIVRAALAALRRDIGGRGQTQYRERLVSWLTSEAEKYWEKFKASPDMRRQVEDYLKMVIYKIVDHEHRLVGEVTRSALNKLTDDDLNRFIEDKAGEDLEWLRINGVVVGGVIGLVMTIFLQFVYNPYVVPLIRQWSGWSIG